MGAANIGYFVGGLVVPVFIAAVWLILVKIINPLKRRPGLSYSIAVVLGWLVVLPSLELPDGPNIGGFAGALLVSVLAWRSYKKETSALSAQAASK